MKKQIKFSDPKPDGSITVEIPPGDVCVVCGGDGHVKFKTPLPARGRFPEVRGVICFTWCHVCSDYHCGKCPLCEEVK